MFWAAAAVAAGLTGCGGAPQPARESTGPKPAAAPLDPANAGSITGKVTFTGPKPAPAKLSMDATPACAKMHSGPVLAEDVVINSNGTLKNVFVRIKEGLPQRDWPTPTTPAKLDQRGCIYTPRMIAVMVNQPIEISNSDDTNHNIHPMPKLNREWNESQGPKGEVKLKTFPKEEPAPILFKCNVHPWMRAWVGVVSHPYFAVTGGDGSFQLKDVPAGEYTIEAWHERFGVQEIKVKVEPKQTITAEISFKG
jgi:hypothetical protein